jgi:hypothetical protein
MFGESQRPSVSYWPSSSRIVVETRTDSTLLACSPVLPGEHEQLGQEVPRFFLFRIQVRGIDEFKLEGVVPRLDETGQVKDRVSVEVAQLGQARHKAIGDEHDPVAVTLRLLHGGAEDRHLVRAHEDRLAPGSHDPHRLLLHVEPIDLVVVGTLRDAHQVVGQRLPDLFRRALEKDRLDPVLVCGPTHICALAVERLLQLRGGRGDVVREEELVLAGNAHALDIDVGRLVFCAAQHRAQLGALELLVAAKAQEVVLRRRHVGVGETTEPEVGALASPIRWWSDGRVQRLDVGEIALGRARQRDVVVRAADANVDASPMERRQRVLQADAEFPYDQVSLAPLLRILILGEVLIAEAPAEVADVPPVLAFDDLGLGGAAERLLIQGVGDDLPYRLGQAPVIEDLLDVEVE